MDGYTGILRRTVSVVGAGVGLVLAAAAAQRVVDLTVRRLPPRGRDVVVDGRTVHVEVWGSDDPTAPTVVAETGLGGTAADWEGVADLLDGGIRLVAVDRPGFGRSEPGPAPDVAGCLRRLEAVLAAIDVDGPVVLAGWSLGGLLALGALLGRPDRVSGLVLVDPSHPDEARRFHDPALHPAGRLAWRAVAVASKLGAAAVAGIPTRLAYVRYSSPGAHEPRWQVPTYATASAGQALAGEMLAFPDVCDEVGRMHADLDGRVTEVPCVLLSASRRRNGDEVDAWAEMHDDLATWVPGTDLLVVDDAGHDVLADRPDVVADAIVRVVERAAVLSRR